MKKTRLLWVLMGAVFLLAFIFSCATVEKKEAKVAPPEKAVEKPAAVEEAPEVSKLLADTHKAAGILCNKCHEKMPPKDDIPSSACLACHANYKELTAALKINPHDAHVTYTRCGECHHVHKPSEVQCLSCHDFDMRAP